MVIKLYFFQILFLGHWQAGMSHSQVVELTQNAQLKIIYAFSLGIVPQGEAGQFFPGLLLNS